MGAPKGVKELPYGKLIRKEERTSFPKIIVEREPTSEGYYDNLSQDPIWWFIS